MVQLENALGNPMGRNVLACAFRTVAAALVDRYRLPVDPDRILFLMDRVKESKTSGSAVFRIPPLWREVLHQLTGREFDVAIKLWEENAARLSSAQMGALLYHELRHLSLDGKTGEHRLNLRHDTEDWGELVPFGDWEREAGALPDLLSEGLPRLEP